MLPLRRAVIPSPTHTPHLAKPSSEDTMTRGEVCLRLAAAESTSAVVQIPPVSASQCRFEADDVAIDIDPPSPYWAGWYAAREQCLGVVSLEGTHCARILD